MALDEQEDYRQRPYPRSGADADVGEAPSNLRHEKSESDVVVSLSSRKRKEPLHDVNSLRAITAMSDTPSRDEIAARLEAVEARTEARFAQLSGNIELRFADLGTKIDQMNGSIGRLVSAVENVKADNKATRRTIIATVIASVLAAIAAIWTTQGNLLAAFQAALAIKP